MLDAISRVAHEEVLETPAIASAVVVHRNSIDTVVNTIADLLRQRECLRQIIIIDNSDNAAIEDVLQEHRDLRLHLLRCENRGYGPAMNIGVRTLDPSADFVLLCTHEARFGDQAVGELMASAHPRDGLVVPLIGRSSKGNVWCAGGTLDGPAFVPKNIGRGEDMMAWRQRRPFVADWSDGAVMLARVAAFKSVGGFNEDYFMYHEDVELCLRLKAQGWATRVVPTTVAWQEPSGVPPYLDARNHLKTVFRHRGRSLLAALALHMLRAVTDALEGNSRLAWARLAGIADAPRPGSPKRGGLVALKYR